MIAFDTNALIRMLIEDDVPQATRVKEIIIQVEARSEQILILSEVMIETVWVLDSVYRCTREEIAGFLEILLHTSTFTVAEPAVIRSAISQYKRGGDFADLIIVNHSKQLQAKTLISFDKKLQNKFPGYVVETIE